MLHVDVVPPPTQSVLSQQPPAAMQPRPAQCFSPPPQTQVPSLHVLPLPQSLSWQHSPPVTQPLGPVAQYLPLAQTHLLVLPLHCAALPLVLQSTVELQQFVSPALAVKVHVPNGQVAAFWHVDGVPHDDASPG
jgi:hypothetical protein